MGRIIGGMGRRYEHILQTPYEVLKNKDNRGIEIKSINGSLNNILYSSHRTEISLNEVKLNYFQVWDFSETSVQGWLCPARCSQCRQSSLTYLSAEHIILEPDHSGIPEKK